MKLADRLLDSPFQGYAYSYPHKMAYRPFDEPVDLHGLWSKEDLTALFLYLHLPFCEMRCGFCNLFTTTNPKDNLVGRYLDALEQQLEVTAEILGNHRFARAAFGGGTPSFLDETELERLFLMLSKHLTGMASGLPTSFELSPGTTTPSKLSLLRAQGITRASIGVQSFVEEETKALGRPQKPESLHTALGYLKDAEFPVLNLDLIYGTTNQTPASWKRSLDLALEYQPEELYLYPLYVRPLTGLGRKGKEASDAQLDLYRRGRDTLLESGYRQISMRLFRKIDCPDEAAQLEGPLYSCQEDGMIGLGVGARSYTKQVHYSTEYAVGRSGIGAIIEDFLTQDYSVARYGCKLTLDDEHRRFLIKSLLRSSGLSILDYEKGFGTRPLDDFPELGDLLELDLATWNEDGKVLQLNSAGMERSDTIGPWLYADPVEERMNDFELV